MSTALLTVFSLRDFQQDNFYLKEDTTAKETTTTPQEVPTPTVETPTIVSEHNLLEDCSLPMTLDAHLPCNSFN